MKYSHNIYPYLSRNLQVTCPKQDLNMDIFYRPMKKGFRDLAVTIDMKILYKMDCSVSNKMDADWWRKLLEEAISQQGCLEIIITDQRS